MCFMTKCPYVPPHEFNPRLPARRCCATALSSTTKGEVPAAARARQDRPQRRVGALRRPLANWASDRERADPAGDGKGRRHRPQRRAAEVSRAHLVGTRAPAAARHRTAPAAGRKACSTRPASSTTTTRASVRRPAPCSRETASRPRSSIPAAAACRSSRRATSPRSPLGTARRRLARSLIDQGYDIIALVPSCALMLKFEWPLIVPRNPAVAKLRRRHSMSPIHRQHRP